MLFKTGDLVRLHKRGSFLERKWFYNNEYMNQTIRPYDYIIMPEESIFLVIEANTFNYDLLCIGGRLENKRLVITVRGLEKVAHLLSDNR